MVVNIVLLFCGGYVGESSSALAIEAAKRNAMIAVIFVDFVIMFL